MDAGLIALGVTLLLASAVPLVHGFVGRSIALAYLGAVAWGLGVGAGLGTLVLVAAVMALVAAAAAVGVRMARRLHAMAADR